MWTAVAWTDEEGGRWHPALWKISEKALISQLENTEGHTHRSSNSPKSKCRTVIDLEDGKVVKYAIMVGDRIWDSGLREWRDAEKSKGIFCKQSSYEGKEKN